MSEIVVAEPIYEDDPPEPERPITRSITMGTGSEHNHVPEPFESERLPASLASEIQRFLRVANLIESDEPRIAYLWVSLFLIKLESQGEVIDARRIGSVLFEVLKTVSNTTGPQALANRGGVQTKSNDLFVPYNILPLDPGDSRQAIMQLPEIKAAVAAIRNIRGIPSANDFQRHGDFIDLFDFLQYCFGFQEGNVANQREHLLLLLANIHIRKTHKQTSVLKLGDGSVDELLRKFFKNYTNWCKFLGRKSNIWLPYVKQEAQQYKLLYLGLYLLIWGEAANLRFMPECLCYIFHHMAYELHGMLTGAVSLTTWEKVMPAYGGQSESFLNNVVTPIYTVIKEEAKNSKSGTADHSTWRNYDDLNEYFWSPDCFQIGWPMRLDHDFFCIPSSKKPSKKPKAKKASASTGSVEERRKEDGEEDEVGATKEEDREPKWLGKTNFVEALIIMACHELESPLQLFDKVIFEDVMSVFITSAFLKLIRVEMVLFLVPSIRKYIEISNHRICTILSWWTQPGLYIGRGMQESQLSVLKYTLFWVLVLLSKFSFSYYFEIKPLIEPTKQIMKIGGKKYEWHEVFPKVQSNAGAIVAVWAPIIVVYFMDTQIWYSVFCTIFGGVYGILHHLGEIRTLGMLRSRFHSLPSAFNISLIPASSRNDQKRKTGFFHSKFIKVSKTEKNGVAKFVLVWNQIINNFRMEDLINNRELDLMTMPMSSELFSGIVRWPVFLLANKFSTALSIAKDFVGKDEILVRKIKKDEYMYCAVKECYESLKYILEILVVGDLEKKIVSAMFTEIEESIERSTLLQDFRMIELPLLLAKCIELMELLVEGNEDHHVKVVKILQDIFELVTNDMMASGFRILELLYSYQQIDMDFVDFNRSIEPELFGSADSKSSIHFPLPDSAALNEQIKRFHLLLTVKDTAMDVPTNLEARRRISFFATSLFMNMPSAPKVCNMLPFCVMTPHYMEDINFSMKELHSSQREVSIIFYMQKIFPDEWKNFLERMGCENLDGLKDKGKEEDLRNWASYRGQTLSRTVRGMMYYREALKLQAFLDVAEDEDILEGYDAVESRNRVLSAQLDAIADMKFTYVLSCQLFGSQKASGDPHAQDIIDLMIRYPSLRVAYIEEKEEMVENKPRKVYSSVLVKAVNGFDQEIYRIKLPGPPTIGEGKPENQNHGIIFTRGEALQTIDMNQVGYLSSI
ncbi:unnamed protein product [Prunus armeniaca]|uniref:1,3-beta-glucan synthase n=1 Tax=Prunus armeniaca TaxID=36596 RepID=A0A6J5UMI4_PRUAR|nr:unnamed protein product [Prunus armeniaca]